MLAPPPTNAGASAGGGGGGGPLASTAALTHHHDDEPLDAVAYAEIALYVVSWYVSSAVCNTSARRVLTAAPHPLWLCVTQFLTAYVCLRAYFAWRPDARVRLPAEAMSELRRLAAAYTVGFVFVNAGYLAVNVSLAETLRSAEPLFSVAFAKLWLRDEFVSTTTTMSLVPIVLGGALSSGGDASFNAYGFVFVCISNTAFALRSVFTKHLKKLYAGDAINVFYEITAMGLVWLLVAAFAWEAVLVSRATPPPPTLADAPLSPSSHSFVQTVLAQPRADAVAFAYLVGINGLTYFLYNQMSFLVLSRVSVVTHAVGNSFRRVVTILASVWVFRNHVSSQNAAGIVLAVLGVVGYSLSKSRDDAAVKAGHVLLPSSNAKPV